MKNVRYIINEKGKKTAVLIPIKDYEKLIETVDELRDIQLYDTIKALNEPTVRLTDYLKKRKARN